MVTENTASSFSVEREAEILEMFSSSQYRNYSIISNADDAWPSLESLKVFRPASWATTLDLVDVITTAPQQVQRRTFTNVTELEDYIEQMSVVGGTRYM